MRRSAPLLMTVVRTWGNWRTICCLAVSVVAATTSDFSYPRRSSRLSAHIGTLLTGSPSRIATSGQMSETFMITRAPVTRPMASPVGTSDSGGVSNRTMSWRPSPQAPRIRLDMANEV